MLKEELEKVQTNFENLRVQQKITNLTKASKKGMIKSVDYSKNFSVRDLQRWKSFQNYISYNNNKNWN